jgi:hypothetical protein
MGLEEILTREDMFEILRSSMDRVEAIEKNAIDWKSECRILKGAVQDCLDGCDDMYDDYMLPDDDELRPMNADDLFIDDE